VGHLVNVNPLEPVVTNFRKFFGEGAKILIDVGTRDGHDLAYLSNKLGKDRVNRLIAIDANPSAVEKTKKFYGFMEVYQNAISDFNGTDMFMKVNHDREDYQGCSSLYSSRIANQQDLQGHIEEIPVFVLTMDFFLNSVGLTEGIIDIVKVDTEGYSWQVLQGFKENLRNVKLLHLETEKKPTHNNHRNNLEVQKFMEDNGFYLADISYEWGWDIEDQIWINKELAINNTECWNR
jgi:FkbM family methyltransferase